MAQVYIALVCCSACSQSEEGPLGSTTYLPPDQVTGAAASSAMGGSVNRTPDGGADAGSLSIAGGGGSGGASVGGGVGGGNLSVGGASNGGSAGAFSSCAAHAIPSKASWKVTASSSGANTPTTNLYDDNLTSRWSSGKPQAGTEWLEVDFGVDVTLTKVTLVLGTSVDDYPRSYEARFSDIAMNAGSALLSGAGMASTDTVMTFPSALTGRYLRISQLGTSQKNYWSAAEIQAQCGD